MRTQRITEKYICDKMTEMMEQVPFNKIKLVDFQKYCGISKSTFYIYFDSIYSVIQKVEDDLFNDVAAINEETPELTKASSLARVKKMKSYLRVFRILCGPSGDPAFKNCANLSEIIIGSGVQTIGEDAFTGCSNTADYYFKPMIAPYVASDFPSGNAYVYQNAEYYDPTANSKWYNLSVVPWS